MGTPARPAIERFTEKIRVVASGCIEWTASTNSTGYGTFNPGDGKQSVVAHRWAYEYHVGPIPQGLHLDHLCRNRRCVNPNHLEPVTVSTNLRRGVGVGQANTTKTHCPAGHPYAGENLYLAPSRLNRMCRICRRERKHLAEKAA